MNEDEQAIERLENTLRNTGYAISGRLLTEISAVIGIAKRAIAMTKRPAEVVYPGDGYDLLQFGAVLQSGDQHYDCGEWHDTNCKGTIYEAGNANIYRRLKPATPEFCVMCGVHSVVAGTAMCAGCAEVCTPVESPDDWVEITDPDHVLRAGIDQFVVQCNKHGDWKMYQPMAASTTYRRKDFREVRCRRKDLPPMPSTERTPDHRQARDIITDIVTWLDPHPPAKTNPRAALDCAEQWLCDNPVPMPKKPRYQSDVTCSIGASERERKEQAEQSTKRVQVRLWCRYERGNKTGHMYVFANTEPPVGAGIKYSEIHSDGNGGWFVEVPK